MDINSLQFKKLDFKALLTMVEWAAAEGWNPGPYDADIYWKTDPDGFYGFFDGSKLLAGGSIVSYNGEFGFMGFFIVHPDYRGQGIGNKLWYLRRDKLLSRLKPGAVIGMDGVVNMQEFYRKGGFEIAFRDERYSRKGEKFEINHNISPVYNDDIKHILAYDKLCFGFERSQFLIPWLNQPESHTFKFVENDVLKGFAFLRKLRLGYKICPLFADNIETAKQLYESCLNTHPDETFFIDIPRNNPDALKLIEMYNAEYTFECARMYYGNPPNNDWSKVFGITSFELG